MADRSSESREAVPPLPTRQRQRRETRELILTAAMAEFSEVGFVQARIEHIAQKAGVTRPTIYAHFPEKEDLLREVQARTEAVALRMLRTRLADPDERGFAHRLVDAVFDLLAEADPVLRREVFSLIVRRPQAVDHRENALFIFLTAEFLEAQTRGEVVETIPVDDLTRIFLNSIFGFLVIEAVPADTRRRDAHQMIEFLIKGAAR